MSKQFEIRRDVVLKATPEQVWDAVTSGTAAWLFPVDVEPGLGGSGGMGTVTSWDPPRHFAVRAEGEDGWFNALEHVIEARGGGTTVMHYVHAGIFVDNWDTQYDGADNHTTFYLHSLGEYLEHFAGRPVTYVSADGPEQARRPGAFGALRHALGLADGSAVGDQVRVEVPGLAPVDGVLDYLAPQFVGIRDADALYRFYGREPWGAPVALGHHLFAPDVEREKAAHHWQSWLDAVYA